MKMIKGSMLNSDHLSEFYSGINDSINNLSRNITYIYNSANDLYNHSSALEDVLTVHISSFYNKLNSIVYSYTSSTVVFVEMFKSTEYADKKFVVNKELNIDSNNQTLTLALKNTEKIEISSVIIEPDSNGSYGNALNNYSNSRVESIFDNDLSTVFEYEKFSSVFETSSLNLILTIKLVNTDVTNGLYIKLFSSSNASYATLDTIEISRDSSTWTQLSSFIDSGSITKNDHYIRYTSIRTGYIRLKFKQTVSEIVNTDFGIKNRYSIGIRGIEVYKNEFDSYGDYVSIPFETGSQISKVSLNAEMISNNDVYFYISANNGGKWVSITPNTGSTIDLLNIDTGVSIPSNLRSIRVRVSVVRKASQDVNSLSQTFPVIYGNAYTLKYMPVKLNAMFGGHISYGDIVKYNIQMPPPFNILNDLYLNSGYKIITDSSQQIFNVYNNSHQTDIDKIGTADTFSDALRLVDNSILRAIGRNYIQTIRYVPYSDTINEDLEILSGNEVIDRWSSITNGTVTTYWIISRILPHPTSMHSYVFLDLDNLCQFYKVNDETDVVTNINIGGSTVPATTTTTTTTTTTVSSERTIYLMYCQRLENETGFYLGMKIDGSDVMYGTFNSSNLGDFASDARIEVISGVEFDNTFGDPADCGNNMISVVKVTFSASIEIAMYVYFGYNVEIQKRSRYYVESTKSWPPYPWDDGPVDGKMFVKSQDDLMNDPAVISITDVTNEDIYNIGMYQYVI